MTSIERRDARLDAVVAADAACERVATGFKFTEGPLWHAAGKFLLFSDMPGDHLRRWSAADGVSTFRQPCNKSNGLTYDRQGRLLVCEHASSRVTRTEADGSSTTLASHWDGKELNSPNDIVCKSDGAIYFTDPTYGRMDVFGLKRDVVLGFRGVYRVAPGGKLSLLADDFGQPNGLCFSLDEKRLFVNDTDRGHIRVFDVGTDGALSGGAVWAEPKGEGRGAPDGMKIDSAGAVFCCGPGGVHVFAPDATPLGVIRTPETAANFCWGDDDLRSLYITASTSLYRVRLNRAGRLSY
ncbi:MAG: SMP-30/gluconolactonase/LRE family protein [Rhodospirillales bacterium]|nr:MAG: SMP-30/gluconolactonase/LRE family protein [Rhodospirillales bacterium]